MSTKSTFTVAAIGGSGPKSTVINFLKTEDGIRLWAWFANDTASRIRPGMSIVAEEASFGKVETHYEKAGIVTELKVPKRQVFLGGTLVITNPETQPLAPVSVSFSDGCNEYAAAYDNKNHSFVSHDEEPF
jgi:hypothetical protein